MKLYHLLILAALLIIPLVSSTAAPNYPSLPDSISSPSFGYVVHYSDDNPYDPASPGPSPDLDYMPAAQAQRMLDTCNNGNVAAPGNPNGLHVGYTNLGFLAPDFLGSTRNLYTWNCSGCDASDAPSDGIRIPAPQYISAGEQCIRAVVGHELFHHVQFAYITFGNWPNWAHPLEGTARMMQDKVYNDLDAWNGAGCCCGYVGQVNGILSSPNQVLWDLTYPSALWWTYLSERLGTAFTTEPNAGADFVQQLWARAQANNSPPDVVKAVREAIAHFTSTSLEALFQDYTIANYTKQMDLSLLATPQHYRYRDENDGHGLTFGGVGFTWSGPPPQTGSSSVVRWGARYFEANVSGCGDGVVGFQSTGDPAGYALVAIKGTDDVQAIYKATVDNYARALLQRSTSPYTRLGVVVTGGNTAASFNYTFDCGQVRLTIREPIYPDPVAYVGPHNAPERFLVKLRVEGPTTLGSPSVQGLDKSDFTVFVGSPSNPANEAQVLDGSYVQGDYWLVVQAPEKPDPTPTTYNLTVYLSTLAQDTKEGAVVYAEKSVDQMLVIDKSWSMSYPASSPKIEAAKVAGKLFVDSARSTDYTGVVSFSGDTVEPNDDYKLEFDLTPVTPASRDGAKTAIGAITLQNMTSIGDGLYGAYLEEVTSGHGRPSPPAERWMVLLSDGMENEARFWSDVRDTIKNNHIKVNAIALGPLSDQPLMQSIATDTGGLYYYVDLPPALSSGASPAAIEAAGVLPLALGDAYALSAERIQTHERLWESSGSMGADEKLEVHIDVQEGGIEDPLFTLAWSGGLMADYLIEDPYGTKFQDLPGAEIYRDDYHATFRAPSLGPGVWHITLWTDASGLDYRASLSGINRYGAQLRLYFGTYGGAWDGFSTNQFLVGQPVPIIANLTDLKGPVLGARVRASVEHPDGTSMTLPLYDDGSHQDNLAGDGIYGGWYYRTTEGSQTQQADTVYKQRGSYNVTLNAEGEDNAGDKFQRVARGSFSVLIPREQGGDLGDSDKDGLSDLYEKLHPCMDYLVYDSNQDPDLDGLTSLDEYGLGTDPCNGDTDNGGENDLSEIKRGSNPLDGSDDALPAPIDVGVISQVSHDLGNPGLKANANLIRYPASAAYQTMRLFRRLYPSDPFIPVREFDAQANGGLYLDEGLAAGTRYYYRLVGVNSAGGESAPSGEFSGVPRSNPVPPVGGIVINQYARFVTSTSVKLRLPLNVPVLATAKDLDNYLATIEMMISNDPRFTRSRWQDYNPDPDWVLSPDNFGHAVVYVKFRDEEGSESETYHAEVDVRQAGELGGIHLRAWLDNRFSFNRFGWLAPTALINRPGVLVTAQGEAGLPPTYSDDDGFATLVNLPAGRYRLFIQYPGYKPLIINDIAVPGGQTVELGDLTLTTWMLSLPLVTR